MDYNLFEGSMDECKALLENEDEWNKLPILNSSSSHLLSDGQIVRFQGMIQDMSNPVLSITEYEVKNKTTGQTDIRSQRSSGYIHIADDEEVLFDSDKTVSKETKVYYCITVPGLNEWVEEYHTTQQHDIVEKLKEQCTTKSLSTNLESKNKRSLDESSNVNETKENMDCSESLVGMSKRLCVRDGVTDSKAASSETARNCKLRFPIENSKGIVCVLNVYTEDCDLKLNEIVDVAGFLSFVPSLESECNEAEEGASCLPLIPHLNTIIIKKLKHSNPLVPPSDNIDEILHNAENIRAELNSVLKKVLFGDGLAADYLICYLLSTVFNRMSGLVLGKFSLNISNIPTDCDYVKHLYSFLTNLVPKSHYLPLTIKNLNTMTFIPKKDYETNSLESGLLQLSNRTFLVLDETKLEPGNLEDKGVRNVRALSNIINRQVIGYNFQYYPLDFITDIPVLILSEGKSMLPSDYLVALDYNDCHSAEFVKELFNEATRFIKNSNLINDIRIYLSVMASLAYKFTADLEAQIAEDFVRMRQSIGQVSAQDLHDLLVLARLFSVSRGSTSLSIQTWEIVQEMEQQRKSRLNR